MAQGLLISSPFYWDMTPEARAFTDRFTKEIGRPPSFIQAGTYGAVLHYLKAVQAAGTDEAKAVMAKMKKLPINDFMTKNGQVREDGRVIRDMYLMQAKTPEESKGEWDLVKMVATVPGNEAFRPLSEGGCPLVGKKQKDSSTTASQPGRDPVATLPGRRPDVAAADRRNVDDAFARLTDARGACNKGYNTATALARPEALGDGDYL